jgi:hypothetical protein
MSRRGGFAISNRWNIGINAWIIQDGNYPDFAIGQVAEFAVEFNFPKNQLEPTCRQMEATHLHDSSYRAHGDIRLRTDEITIVDIGILAYCGSDPVFAQFLEDRFEAEIWLGVDPYPYFERLSKNEKIPPLIYSWQIRSILRQTAPFIESVEESGLDAGRKIIRRDLTRLGWEEISQTDAWNDDRGDCAEYVLVCELLDVPPKRVSATAT